MFNRWPAEKGAAGAKLYFLEEKSLYIYVEEKVILQKRNINKIS